MDDRKFRRAVSPGLIPGRSSRKEMDEEIASHLELRVQDLVDAGMSPEAARAEALRRFGDLEEARRALRDGARRRDSARRHRERIGAIVADARFAWRQMCRAPMFTAIAITTLATAIGLTTATVAIVDHVLIRPLPFAQPDRLVTLSSVASTGANFTQVSSSNWQDWRGASLALEGTAIHLSRPVDVRVDDGASRIPAEMVAGEFFQVLRPRFVVGRAFQPMEVAAPSTEVVISERLWRSRFGGDHRLQSPLRLITGDVRVVGVVADGHEYPAGTDIWWQTAPPPARNGTRNNINWEAIARLRAGVSMAQAEAELGVIAARIRESDPSALYSYGVKVRSLKDQITGGATGYLHLLLGAVSFVLLIACANVAAANLARATRRSREMAVRAAIGAGRRRLLQQLLVEHAVLAVIAGALGVALGWIAVRVVVATWGARVPRAFDIELDPRVLAVACVVTLLASMLSGLLPALVGSRMSLSALLASGARGTTRGGQARVGRLLVAAQIAIAVMLMCGSVLTIRSFQALVTRDLGFDIDVATIEAGLVARELRSDTAAQYAYWSALRDAMIAIPGVVQVGVANWTPMGGGGASFIEIEGKDLENPGASFRVVSDDYLAALGVPLVAGRMISVEDAAGAPLVTVVNEAMARTYWPGENPLGKRVRATSMEGFGGPAAPWRTVVGVVGDVRNGGYDSDTRAEMYVPHRQAPYWIVSMTAVVRSSIPIASLLPEIRARARAVNAGVAVEVGTMAARAGEGVAPQRMTMSVLSLFGAVSLLLAALGTYGLLSYLVANRLREMAVRAALGATRAKLVALIVLGSSGLIGAGVAIGLAGALALSRVLESQLVDVRHTDPAAFASSAAVIAGAALLAALVPALRASGADPAEALRAE